MFSYDGKTTASCLGNFASLFLCFMFLKQDLLWEKSENLIPFEKQGEWLVLIFTLSLRFYFKNHFLTLSLFSPSFLTVLFSFTSPKCVRTLCALSYTDCPSLRWSPVMTNLFCYECCSTPVFITVYTWNNQKKKVKHEDNMESCVWSYFFIHSN